MNATAYQRVDFLTWRRILTMGRYGVEAARWYTRTGEVLDRRQAAANSVRKYENEMEYDYE